VRFGDKVYPFTRINGKRIYTCDLSEDAEFRMPRSEAYVSVPKDVIEPTTSVETVEGNTMLYTKKEVAAADRARAFSAAIGHPSTKVLIEMVRSMRVEGLDFGVNDVMRSLAIYGPSIESVRGKTAKKKRTKLAERKIRLVSQSDVSLHMDIMFAGGVPFLISVAKPTDMLQSEWIKSRAAKDIRAAILKQTSKLAAEGFRVTELTSDGEGAIAAITTELEAEGTRVSISPPGSHSPHVDVKIKQVKNVMRSILTLPYLWPKMLVVFAAIFAVNVINMLPSFKNAHNYSPYEVVYGRSISASRDLGARCGGKPLAFGSRCEVYEGTTNTMADRTRSAIFLGSKSDSYSSSLFFLTDTCKVVSRGQWTPLPMDATTIDRMNAIARRGILLPSKIPIVWKGVELEDDEDDSRPATVRFEGEHRVSRDQEHGPDFPDVVVDARGRTLMRADEAVVPIDQGIQLSETPAENVIIPDPTDATLQSVRDDVSGGILK
jgi:hypothetical protein